MDTIHMNSRNSKTSDPHRLLLNLADEINLKRSDKFVALSNRNIYYTWKNVKKSYKNNKFKISAPTWNEEYELPDESYSVSGIQDYFEFIIKKMEKKLNFQWVNRLLYHLRTMYTKQVANDIFIGL